MFNVVLYTNFSKPDNSLRLPTGGEPFPCLTVEPCGIVSPVISFARGNDWNPSQINYAYIEEWRRYYYVSEWMFNTGRWYASLVIDPLTSFREEILSQSEYVLRSSSSYDGKIIDEMYPATTDFTTNVLELDGVFDSSYLEGGTLVLGVANGKEGSKGGITYYCGTQRQLTELFQFMYDTTDWLNGANIDDISNDLLKCLINPAQYLTSCMWFPISLAKISNGNQGTVGAGWWETGITLDYAKGECVLSGAFARGSHPQSGRGYYLNCYPYTQLKLYVPGIGRLELDTNRFPGGGVINFRISVDTVTGLGTVFVYPATSNAPAGGQSMSGQIGVPISLTSMMSDLLGGVSAVGNAIAQSPSVTALIGAAAGIADAAKAVSPDVTVVGSNGNMSTFQYPVTYTAVYRNVVDDDPAHLGKPLCSKRTLSSLSGFTQCLHFDTNLPCTAQEMKMIKSYMESGVFIE